MRVYLLNCGIVHTLLKLMKLSLRTRHYYNVLICTVKSYILLHPNITYLIISYVIYHMYICIVKSHQLPCIWYIYIIDAYLIQSQYPPTSRIYVRLTREQCWLHYIYMIIYIYISANVILPIVISNNFYYWSIPIFYDGRRITLMGDTIDKRLHFQQHMETFSAFLALREGNSPVTWDFPSLRPVTRSFEGFVICAKINGWINNHETGDLRCHRVHYDITVTLTTKHVIYGFNHSPAEMAIYSVIPQSRTIILVLH